MHKPAIAIIQARMSSSRLPGKVLLPLAEKPVIHHIVDRVALCKNVGKIIVATSNEKSDDKLSDYCNEKGIDVYRGSLNNVLSRYCDILEHNDYKYCVRITGDCPLIHPPFIDAQIDALKAYNADLIWTKMQSSVLEGQGVKSKDAVLHVMAKSNDPDNLEHVGSKYFLNNPEEFNFVELKIPDYFYNYQYRITVDQVEDYEFLSTIYNNHWSGSPINLMEVLEWLNSNNKCMIKNKNVQHSQINQQLNQKKRSFKPITVGTFNWSGV